MASILVVEDVPAVLLSVRIVLEAEGHRVVCAADGTAGLTLLAKGDFDLVITDIWLPGSSGTEVIRRGKALSPRTHFLAITGGKPNFPGHQDSGSAMNFGADRMLPKPFEKEELLSAVTQLIDMPV